MIRGPHVNLGEGTYRVAVSLSEAVVWHAHEDGLSDMFVHLKLLVLCIVDNLHGSRITTKDNITLKPVNK